MLMLRLLAVTLPEELFVSMLVGVPTGVATYLVLVIIGQRLSRPARGKTHRS